jgi:hypothetical protein
LNLSLKEETSRQIVNHRQYIDLWLAGQEREEV